MKLSQERENRLAAMVDFCRQMLEAEQRAEEGNDPETVREACGEAVRCLWRVVGLADDLGAVSGHYEAASAGVWPEDESRSHKEVADRHRGEVLARFLMDAGGPQGALTQGGALSDSAFVWAQHVMARLTGRGTTDPLPARKGGRPAAPFKNLGARQKFAEIVHYRAGKEGLSVEKALEATGDRRSYDAWRKSLSDPVAGEIAGAPPEVYPEPKRKLAKAAGRAVRRGHSLSPEQTEIAERCEWFLSRPDALAQLGRDANWGG